MTEAAINHLAPGWRAESAGSHPTGQVHPLALAALDRHGITVHDPHSKSWDRFAGQAFDRVLTVCDRAAGESCPAFAGPADRLHWSLPDPAAADGDEHERSAFFDAVLADIITRVKDRFT